MPPDTVEEALKNEINKLWETQPRKRSRKTNTTPPPNDTESDSAWSTRSMAHFLKDEMGLKMGGISNKSEKANNDSFEKLVGIVLEMEQETFNNKKVQEKANQRHLLVNLHQELFKLEDGEMSKFDSDKSFEIVGEAWSTFWQEDFTPVEWLLEREKIILKKSERPVPDQPMYVMSPEIHKYSKWKFLTEDTDSCKGEFE